MGAVMSLNGVLVNIGGTTFAPDKTLELKDGILSVSIPNHGILTQAEFDALPEDEKNYGIYFIDDGKEGTPGKSAYEYAVEGGYTGTEEDFAELLGSGPWLSIKGTTITVENKRVRNVGAPTNPRDAATKEYVDAEITNAISGAIEEAY